MTCNLFNPLYLQLFFFWLAYSPATTPQPGYYQQYTASPETGQVYANSSHRSTPYVAQSPAAIQSPYRQPGTPYSNENSIQTIDTHITG